MVKWIQNIAEQEVYYNKSSANNVDQINCRTPNIYIQHVYEFKK